FLPGNWPGSYPPSENLHLPPGQSVSLIVNVQLPGAVDLKGHVYHLATETRVMPSVQAVPAVPATTLRAISPSLTLLQPGAAQQLLPKLYPTSGGWCLQVLTGDGSRPVSPLTAEIWTEASFGQGRSVATGGPLEGGNRGVWVGRWSKQLR